MYSAATPELPAEGQVAFVSSEHNSELGNKETFLKLRDGGA